MSIFRRDPEPLPPASPVPPTRTDGRSNTDRGRVTHIAEGSKVVGRISGTAELHIEGEVEGEIELDNRVVVGSKGRVKGQIQARAVQVAGKLQGNVKGLERVEVLASGTLDGDVTSPRVIIAEGAFFKGKVEMTGSQAGKTPEPKRSTAPTAGGAAAGSSAKPPAAGDSRPGGRTRP